MKDIEIKNKKTDNEYSFTETTKELWEKPAIKLLVYSGITLGAIYGAGYVFRVVAYAVNGWKELNDALKK